MMQATGVINRTGAVAGAVALSVLVGAGLALSPWATSGLLLSGAVLAVCILEPLGVLAALLLLGFFDLSLLTGGMKALFVDAGGLDMNGLRLIGATLGFAAVVLVHPATRELLWRRPARIYVLFLAFAASSLLYSWSLVEGAKVWVKLLYPFLVFLLVLGVPTKREQLERLMDAVLAGAAFTAVVLNPLLILLGDYSVDPDGRVMLTRFSAQQTVVAPYFVLMILMALTRYATRRQLRYLLLALACAPWMVIGISRMAFAEAMVALAILGIVGAVAAGNVRFAVSTAVTSALLSIALLPAVLRRSLGYVPGPGELLGLLRDPAWLAQHLNTSGRSDFWALAARAFLQHPLIGSGLGSTRPMLTSAIRNGRGDVHNEYLRMAASTGLVGAGLLASAMALWLRRVVRLVRNSDQVVREFALPATAAIPLLALDCLAANTFDYYSATTQYVFFLVAGAMAAAALAQGTGAAPPPPEPRP